MMSQTRHYSRCVPATRALALFFVTECHHKYHLAAAGSTAVLAPYL